MLKASMWKRALAIACTTALTAALSACSGSSSSSSSNSRSASGSSDTLTIGVTGDTSGLNPLGGGCGPAIYCYPAYDSLICLTSDGKFEPDLATSWKFTDATHRTLQLTLRQRAYFTDGSELTGEAAANSINKFRAATGPLAGNAFPISDVRATGTYTLEIHYSVAITEERALTQLSPQSVVGAIVGPEGIKNPKSLETSSDGIGPYTLVGSETTKGRVYTYAANSQYFAQDAIRYKKVVMKPMADQNDRLNALLTGQIDWAQGLTSDQAATATGKGFQVSTGRLGRTPQGVQLLVLANRSAGPLAKVKVRQAIQYAVPRDQINKAVYGGEAQATSSLVAAGDEGYNAEATTMYYYDVKKAKELLTEAGYPEGVTISVLDASFFDPGNALGRALESALKPAGITLKLVTNDSPPGDVTAAIASKKYDAFVWSAVGGTYINAVYQFAEKGGLLNPFEVESDDELMSMINAASLAEPSEQDALMRKATARLDELSWAVAVSAVPSLQVLSSKVKGVPSKFSTYELDPFSPIIGQTFYSEST